jgi:hypothetical protein
MAAAVAVEVEVEGAVASPDFLEFLIASLLEMDHFGARDGQAQMSLISF